MAQELSAKAELISQETNIGQNIILEIDGVPLIFGAQPVFRVWQIGDDGVTIGQSGLTIGGLLEIAESRAYVMVDGTTSMINQQLELDSGGAGSITKFSIKLVDKNQELTRLFSPGQTLTDILGREATVSLGFKGGSHPKDSIRLFEGIIDAQETGAGWWTLTVAHAQHLTRSKIIQQVSTTITSAIDDTVTTIPLESVDGLLEPVDTMRTLIRIEDELIEYTGISGNDLTGATRGVETTLAVSHDIDTELQSYFIFEDNPIDLALKLMLSRGGTPSYEGYSIDRFVQTIGLEEIENAVIFSSSTLQDDLGLVVGDLFTITGATNAANNVTDQAITGFTTGSYGTAVILGGAGLVSETTTSAVVDISSQYDVFPVTNGGVSAGANMKPKHVDVARHLNLKELLIAQIPTMKIHSEGDENLKEFIVNELFKPIGFYQIPKSRYSVSAVIPPLVVDTLKKFDSNAVKNPDRLKIGRTVNKNFYNAIAFKFNPDPINLSKFNSGEVVFSQRSVNRIDTYTRTLEIKSRGLKGDAATRNIVKSLARRLEDRYQFAPETITVETNYKTGFNVEVSDIVLFGDSELQLTDINDATRNFVPRLMEVINRKLNLKTGKLAYELLDTAAGADGRYSVVSPNSYIDSGSSTTKIVLKTSFGTGEFELERLKWENFIGEEILIRSQDWSFQEVVTLIGFSDDSLKALDITALSVSPSEDYLVDLPYYPDNDNIDDRRLMKSIHAFWTPRVTITANSINAFRFTVAPGDIDKFLVDAFVRVHSSDFSDDSVESALDDDAQIIEVDTGTNTIIVDRDLTFTPQLNDQVDLIGFKDGGLPYRLL
jgi:hypothetical protein